MEENGVIRIEPPLFIASTLISCWKCGSSMQVVTLLAPNVPEMKGEVCLLSGIKSLPTEIATFIQQKHPGFKMSYSKTTESNYFGNVCPSCGVLTGDFFLHSEPDAAFFPMTDEDAAGIALLEIPLNASVDLECEPSIGAGDLIYRNGKKSDAEQAGRDERDV